MGMRITCVWGYVVRGESDDELWRTCSAFERRSPRARSWPCDEDAIRPLANGAKLAVLANGELVTMEGSGHAPHVRDPVKVNLLLRDFIGRSRP